ncbi:MAG: arylsulfatase [Acidobacteriota bacterium]|nr:MAG: arylsulfatase [Acidobacteriota bacterium]
MKISILLLLLPLLLSACPEPDSASQPNIVLILSDDQGWGDLSINGNQNIQTPHIDGLAQRGVSFDRFFVSPVCSPTRAEMLTGRYHVRGGVYGTSAGGERLDLDETTLAEVFKEAGYTTAAYGKWHNGMQPPYHPNARGFDDFYGFCSGHWGDYFSPMLEHNGRLVEGNGFIIDDLTDHGLRFIEENRNRPFLLYLPFNTPHSPMQVPERWWKEFESKELLQTHRDPEKEDIVFTRAALAMCANIDWNVGRLLGKLEELNLSDRTIVVYFSDNGPNSWRWNGGMKGRKGSTDEGGVRSPLFIQWPGQIPPGKKVQEIAGAIDLLPTLADLAGITFKPERPLDGISLKALIAGETSSWPDRLVFNHWRKQTSVRSQQFRLDAENRLYDLENDPGQTVDVAAEKPLVTSRLTRAKEDWESAVLSELSERDSRPFTIGYPGFKYTQVPARDGHGHGNIERSNRHPNCTFFTNWTSLEDRITWEVEVLAEGEFEVEIYYTCPPADVGAAFELTFGESKLSGKILEAHDPPLRGMADDRVERIESYVKDFKPLKLGTIQLSKGTGTLTLKATHIPGSQVMDFRLLMLKRL